MLALLAALVPIAGSLLVAIDVLSEQSSLKHERTARSRAQDLREEHLIFLQEQLGMEYSDASPLARAFEERMLANYGVFTSLATYGSTYIDSQMSGPEMSRAERRGQWVLIGSALAGIVLLALGAIPS